MYLSNRHLYNWAIARTNLAVIEAADVLARDFGWPSRVRVDGLTYEMPDPAARAALDAARSKLKHVFRLESLEQTKRPDGIRPGSRYVDPAKLAADVKAEIATWWSRHKSYTGVPGSGKSYTVKTTHQSELKYSLALTNVCARQLTVGDVAGETIHSRLRLFSPDELGEVVSSLQGGTIWLDELSMINPYIWSTIFVVGLECSLIITGDPRQCHPIKFGDGGLGADPIPYEGPLMKAIVGGSTVLTTDYRNDSGLIAFREAIIDYEYPAVYLRKLLADRPQLDGEQNPDAVLARETHLVWGHSYRRQLNAAILAARGLHWERRAVPKGSASSNAGLARNKRGESFTFNVSAHVKVVARTSRKGSYLKGSFYRLERAVSHDSTVARLIPLEAGTDASPEGSAGDPIVIKPSQLIDFGIGYAITISSAQGMTISGPAAIHQMGQLLRWGEHREIAYTGITRFCSLDKIIIVKGKLDLPDPPAAQAEVYALVDDDLHDIGSDLSPVVVV